MRVLVTGGSGFIGSHVLDRLLAAGIEPRNFDLRPSPYHDGDEIETVIGDVLDRDSVTRAMDGCDAVIHLAAAADVGEVARDPVPAEDINARGTLNVLEAARAAGVSRVIYGSTIWVYTGNGSGPTHEDSPVSLSGHLYTATKLAGEMYCRSYLELYGLEYTILRFGIPFGPRSRPAAVIPTFVNRALAGQPLTIAGDGRQGRRFVYVEDLAEGIVRALRPHAANRTFNLASSQTVTIRELADTVREAVGDVEIIHGPARAADFSGSEVSSERAAAELDWAASTPFAEGVRRYVAWHRAQDEAPLPEAAAETTPERVSRPRVLVSVFSCLAGALVVLLLTLLSANVNADQAHTAGMTSLLVLVLYMSYSPQWRVKNAAARGMFCWTLILLYLVALLWPRSRNTFDLATPDMAVILVSIAGAGAGILLAMAGWRVVRARTAPDSADGIR